MRRPLFYSRAACSPACTAVRPSVCSTVTFSRFRNHSRFSGSRWVQQWLKKPRERAASPCPSGAFFRARKLQNGTVLPEVSDLFREFAELPDGFAVRADQPAQKRGSVVYRLHESVFRFLIFCAECAIL